MRINEIKKNEVNVTLSSSELVMLGNILHFYQRFYTQDPNAGKPDAKFHELSAQVIIGRDLSQYGHLDDFSLSCVCKHKNAVDPNTDLAQFYPKSLENLDRKDDKQTEK